MGKRILLADDSVTIQKVVELTFLDEDYEVVATSNGADALSRLAALEPDVVIADVHMPGAGGYEVCEGVKAWRPATPVVLLVGTFEPFDEARARAAGANYYLKKPFDSQELLQQVEALLAAVASTAPAEATAAAASPVEAAEPAVVAAADEMEPWQSAEDLELPVEAELYAGPLAEAEAEVAGDAGVEGEAVPAFGGQPLPDELVLESSPWTEAEERGEAHWRGAVEEPSVSAPAEAAASAASVAEPAAQPLAEPGVGAAPAPAAAPAMAPANGGLSAEDVERIARRVVELIGDGLVREVAWEVIPDMAELVIKDRVRELERQLEGP
jgi:CheY-like chemotaxis protein